MEAKCKLYTKEMNPKPIGSGDMEKENKYFREGLNKNNNWKDRKLLSFGFLCPSILPVEEEKDGAIFWYNLLPSKPMTLDEDM